MHAFSFTPKSEAEIHAIQNRGLLPDGIYPFIVREVKQEVSKSNNNMLKVVISVTGQNNDRRNVVDYLLATDEMMFKLRHFCETVGLEKEYESGSFMPNQFINRGGFAKIGTKKGNAKDDGSGFYPDKNTVKDYVKLADVKKTLDGNAAFNDDINF